MSGNFRRNEEDKSQQVRGLREVQTPASPRQRPKPHATQPPDLTFPILRVVQDEACVLPQYRSPPLNAVDNKGREVNAERRSS
jgi:hypothetical protein